MTISSYPFDGQVTTEAQYSKLFRELQDSGVAASADALDFKVSADASGMNVKVQPGFAILRGHAIESTAVETLTIAASGQSARTDRVVMRLDPTANAITLAVLTGTSITAPAVTQTDQGIFEVSLGVVAVDANVTNIASTKVTDDRRFVGHNVTVYSTRPTSPRKGLLGFNTTTSVWEFWSGSAWTDLLAWASLSGKPATFPPSSHTHDPSGYSVAYAASAGNADTVDGQHAAAFATAGHGHASVPSADYAANAGNAYGVSQGNVSCSGVLTAPGFNVNGLGSGIIQSGITRDRIIGGSTMIVGSDGTFGRAASSRRYKKDIADLHVDIESLRELRPVEFRYDNAVENVECGDELVGGFIAEEVAESFPLGARYDEDGQAEDINERAMLAAAFALIRDQESRLASLEALVSELIAERSGS